MNDVLNLIRSRFELFGYETPEFQVSQDPQDPDAQILTLRLKKHSPAFVEALPQNDKVYLNDGNLNSDYLLKNAKILLESKDFTSARKILTALKSSGKNTHTILLLLTQCWEGEKKIPEAIGTLEEAIAFQGSYELHLWAAQLNKQAGRPYQAVEWFERALQAAQLKMEQEMEIRRELIKLLAGVDRWNDTEKHLVRLIALNAHDDSSLAQLGALRMRQNRVEESRFEFDTALSVNPKNLLALEGLGKLALRNKDFSGAHDCFSRYLEIHPWSAKVLTDLVSCAYALKNYGTAFYYIQQYVKTMPANADLLYILASLQFHLGRYDESRTSIDQVLMMKPDHIKARELKSHLRF